MREVVFAFASAGLGLATRARRALTARGVLASHALPAPVLSVGNLAAGGTGKTPLVEHCARELLSLGAKPVILSRGYGPRVPGENLNDEGLVLRQNLPDVPQRQGADRVAIGREALAADEGDCLLLDDGFQHLRLARDLDIVAVDTRRPFTDGVFRDGAEALRHAGAVVLTRAVRATDAERAWAEAEVRRLAPDAALAVTDHEPRSVVAMGTGTLEDVSVLRGARVYAAAGIAHPKVFEETLTALGAEVIRCRGFPDHQLGTRDQLALIVREAIAMDAERVLVTQKDAVKLERGFDIPEGPPVSSLRIGLTFRTGEDALRGALETALRAGRQRSAGA